MGESSRCLAYRVKERNGHVTSAVYKDNISNNHSQANISNYKLIYQDNKQVAREAGEAIHIRINNSALICNTGKMYIPEICNNLLGADISSSESNQVVDSNLL